MKYKVINLPKLPKHPKYPSKYEKPKMCEQEYLTVNPNIDFYLQDLVPWTTYFYLIKT